MFLRNGREISSENRPYIIAELNSSHNGSVDKAKEMMDAALSCGCDCVKFQSWTYDTLYADEYYENNPLSLRIIKKFSFSEEELISLFDYGKQIGIDVSSTPYSEREVDFLVERADAPFIKIASMEINNLPYLEYIGKKHVPVILSTGMADYSEIETAVKTIIKGGCSDLCILHCVSVYPAPTEMINLRNMVYLKELFREHEIGYSDHTLGTAVACGAVALGATVIEKHFTLDKTKTGMDNSMATEPEEMSELVRQCHNVFSSLGSSERIITEDESQQRLKMRRSVVAARDINEGEILSEDMVNFKRPGDGIPVDNIGNIIGCVVASNIKKGHLIHWECIERKN